MSSRSDEDASFLRGSADTPADSSNVATLVEEIAGSEATDSVAVENNENKIATKTLVAGLHTSNGTAFFVPTTVDSTEAKIEYENSVDDLAAEMDFLDSMDL